MIDQIIDFNKTFVAEKGYEKYLTRQVPRQEIGCRAITLNVWTGNDAAEHFYKKHGHAPTENVHGNASSRLIILLNAI